MCEVYVYDRIHPSGTDDANSSGGRQFINIIHFKHLIKKIDFIDSWIQFLNKIYVNRASLYKQKIQEL